MKKYQVIVVDCKTNDIFILATKPDYKSCTEFVSIYITKNFETDGWTKCVLTSNNSVSIYQYSYIFPKSLRYKIHIVEFNEDNIKDDKMI